MGLLHWSSLLSKSVMMMLAWFAPCLASIYGLVGLICCVEAFEEDTFNHLVKRAEGDSVSVSEVIRTYVEWGMEDEQREMKRFRKLANETDFEVKVDYIKREENSD